MQNLIIWITSILSTAIGISIINGDLAINKKSKVLVAIIILIIGFPGTIISALLFLLGKPIEKLLDYLER